MPDTGAILKLAENEVHLWRTEVASVPDELIEIYYDLLLPAERERNQRYRFDRDRRCDSVTRLLARTVLSNYADIESSAWWFIKGEHGKPEIGNDQVKLRFNLSHTSQHVVCAVTRSMHVGVDIEHTQRKNKVLDIAGHYFSRQEIIDLFELPVAQQPDRFFDYWTLKEAYMKARGEGISLGLGNFSFDLSDNQNIRISFSQKIEDEPEAWRFWLFNHCSEHRTALAIKNGVGAGEPILRFFDTIPLQEKYNDIL